MTSLRLVRGGAGDGAPSRPPDDAGAAGLADAFAAPYEDVAPGATDFQARASRAGAEFDHEALELVEEAGGVVVRRHLRVEGHPLDALVRGRSGAVFLVAAHGTPDRTSRSQAGLRRTDTVLKVGCRAQLLRAGGQAPPLVVVTSHLPAPGSEAARLLAELGPAIHEVVATVGDYAGFRRLARLLGPEPPAEPPAAPWRIGPGCQLSLFGLGEAARSGLGEASRSGLGEAARA